MEYLPHQQRVLLEKEILDERLSKLTAFLPTPGFYGLDSAEQDRLERQAQAMRAYQRVLGERIAAFA